MSEFHSFLEHNKFHCAGMPRVVVWIYRFLLIRLSVDGQSGCFPFGAIINNAVMSIRVRMFA